MSDIKYVKAVGSVWEFGIISAMDPAKRMVKAGFAKTIEEAMQRNEMSPFEGANQCSGNSSEGSCARPSHYSVPLQQ